MMISAGATGKGAAAARDSQPCLKSRPRLNLTVTAILTGVASIQVLGHPSACDGQPGADNPMQMRRYSALRATPVRQHSSCGLNDGVRPLGKRVALVSQLPAQADIASGPRAQAKEQNATTARAQHISFKKLQEPAKIPQRCPFSAYRQHQDNAWCRSRSFLLSSSSCGSLFGHSPTPSKRLGHSART